MTIELNTGTSPISPEVKPDLNWVVYSIPVEEIIQPDEIPSAVKFSEIEFKGKIISIILPDASDPLFNEDDFLKDNHATKSLRKIFKFNNDQIGIGATYEEDLQNRKEIIEIIKQQNPDITPQILKSMQRSLLARAYHTEKRIRQIENNNPIRIIKRLASNSVFSNEPEYILRERKSANAAAVFDNKIEKIFKKFLRKTTDSDKDKLGEIQALKQGYEYYIAKIIENYLKYPKSGKTVLPISFVSLVNHAIIREQEIIRITKLNNAGPYLGFQRIFNVPNKNLEELIEDYIMNQIKISSFFK